MTNLVCKRSEKGQLPDLYVKIKKGMVSQWLEEFIKMSENRRRLLEIGVGMVHNKEEKNVFPVFEFNTNDEVEDVIIFRVSRDELFALEKLASEREEFMLGCRLEDKRFEA